MESIELLSEDEVRAYCNYVFNRIVNGLNGELKDIVKNKGFIAGGLLRSKFSGEPINDVDIYFLDNESADRVRQISEDIFNKKVKQTDYIKPHLFNKYKEEIESEYFLHKNTFISKNAFTFKNFDLDLKVQLIYKYAGRIHSIIYDFDFSNSKAAFNPRENRIYYGAGFRQSLIDKKLFFNSDCKNPIYSLDRLIKFIKQDYNIDRNEILKICETVSNLDKKEKNEYCEGSVYY